MSLYICSLNSGSNGNCYYIGNDNDAVLIDAGLSCKDTEKRMKKLGLNMGTVKAIFISHEHTDHVKGLPMIAEKYSLPIYITPQTAKFYPVKLKLDLFRPFKALKPVQVGSLQVIPFCKEHDAADPHSFIVMGNGVTIGIFTDIGRPCENLIHHFRKCHGAFLETNYDEEMLEKGTYPIHLKNRIRNGKGHLSNRQAWELYIKHRPPFMSHLVLSHLSANNNREDKVEELFGQQEFETKIIIASRFESTQVYKVSHSGGNDKSAIAPGNYAIRPTQLRLF